MNVALLSLFLIFAFVLESTITTLPLMLICLLCFAIVRRDMIVFLIAFFVGIWFDIATVHPVGITSLFFLLFIFLVFLYQRKYEIDSYPFVVMAAFIGSGLFLFMFGYENILIKSGISAFLAMLLFGMVTFQRKITEKTL